MVSLNVWFVLSRVDVRVMFNLKNAALQNKQSNAWFQFILASTVCYFWQVCLYINQIKYGAVFIKCHVKKSVNHRSHRPNLWQKKPARDERRKSINIQWFLTKQRAVKLFWGRPPRNDFCCANSFAPSFLRLPMMLTSWPYCVSSPFISSARHAKLILFRRKFLITVKPGTLYWGRIFKSGPSQKSLHFNSGRN